MDRWAEQLWAAGLRTVEGRLVGDDRVFSGEPLGAGWPWDNLAWGYSAPIGALQANVDAAEVHVVAAAREGDPASVTLVPAESGLELEQAVFTGPASGTASIELARAPGATRLKVTGVIPLGSEPLVRTAAVDQPTRYFLSLLASALARRGILVRDGVAAILDLPAVEWPKPDNPVLLEHRSAPLRDLAQTVMKSSQNQYAETLLRALARSEPGAVATTEGGRGVLRRVLVDWGIPADSFVQADGSGLSRYNYVTANTLADVLAHMYRDPRHRAPWLESLSVGGVDGTLEKRFKVTVAEGRVRGKTGSIANVRALSGYVTAANGEQVLFVIVLNNVTAPGPRLTEISDAIVVRLARFAR
jgi:D-alanyl-D-alanine carboxypeptidase/D-alanyl-D-alanine-endopeptidase (penicillin-binding protein 4)